MIKRRSDLQCAKIVLFVKTGDPRAITAELIGQVKELTIKIRQNINNLLESRNVDIDKMRAIEGDRSLQVGADPILADALRTEPYASMC